MDHPPTQPYCVSYRLTGQDVKAKVVPCHPEFRENDEHIHEPMVSLTLSLMFKVALSFYYTLYVHTFPSTAPFPL
jgi:hypothetical protein